MADVIEVIARVLHKRTGEINTEQGFPIPEFDDDRDFYTGMARAALSAALECMREPSEAVRNAPRKSGQIGPIGADEVWQAMLDQLRKEALDG